MFTIQKVATKPQVAPKVEFKPKANAPKFNNQKVVRSDGRNDGYVYQDWRNW
jgi:hypothetical protein